MEKHGDLITDIPKSGQLIYIHGKRIPPVYRVMSNFIDPIRLYMISGDSKLPKEIEVPLKIIKQVYRIWKGDN